MMGKKIDLELIEKIVKLRKEGKKLREISQEVGFTPSYVDYVYRNRHALIRRWYGISDEIDKMIESTEAEDIKEGDSIKELTFKLQEQDYNRYAKIKYEIIKSLDMGSDEYVFMRLLDAYDELQRIKEQEREYRDYLKYIGLNKRDIFSKILGALREDERE